ncbi:MAG: ATP-dependent Clp protease ATP-binding subunit ClpA, partial [Maricaulis sp.]
PEFRNRLDAIIPFAPLGPESISRVVEKFVLQLEAQLTDRGVTFELTPDATAWLAERGYDSRFGARPLARIIQEHIKKPLADEILFGELKKGGLVKVDTDPADDTRLDFHITPGDRLLPRGPKAGKKSKKVEV